MREIKGINDLLTINGFANAFNVGAIALVLVMSLIVARSYALPFFEAWVSGYAMVLLYVGLPLFFSLDEPRAPIAFLEAFLILVQAGFFFQVGFLLQGRKIEAPLLICLTAAYLLSIALLLAGISPKTVAVIPFLFSVASSFFLGYLFIFKLKFFQGLTSSFWMGLPFLLVFSSSLVYPFMPLDRHWIGFSFATVMHLLLGTGMIVFILEESKKTVERLSEEKLCLEKEKVLLQGKQIEALEEADRLKDEFLGAISHELRSPLTVITGYSEILFEISKEPDQIEHLEKVQQATLRLRRMVDDLFDFVKLENRALKFEKDLEDLCEIVAESAESYELQARKMGLTLEMHLPAEEIFTYVDAVKISQVITNLLDNAFKFSPKGGRVSLFLRETQGEARFEISDEGIGIPSGEQDKIFSRFYQVRGGYQRQHEGAGLGLTIAEAIVTAHGGSIGVKSEEGQGSRFWFTLPAPKDEAANPLPCESY